MISLLAAALALSVKLVFLHDFALAASAGLSSKLVSLRAAAILSPKLVSLHDFAFGCRCRFVSQVCFPSLSPFMISLLVAAAALSPKLVFFS